MADRLRDLRQLAARLRRGSPITLEKAAEQIEWAADVIENQSELIKRQPLNRSGDRVFHGMTGYMGPRRSKIHDTGEAFTFELRSGYEGEVKPEDCYTTPGEAFRAADAAKPIKAPAEKRRRR